MDKLLFNRSGLKHRWYESEELLYPQQMIMRVWRNLEGPGLLYAVSRNKCQVTLNFVLAVTLNSSNMQSSKMLWRDPTGTGVHQQASAAMSSHCHWVCLQWRATHMPLMNFSGNTERHSLEWITTTCPVEVNLRSLALTVRRQTLEAPKWL